jgi:predicted RNA-binding protein with PIN domain
MRWLIDGHNLIGQMPDLRLDDPHDEEKLLEHLRRYRARTGHKLTVIFDAGQTYQAANRQTRGGINIHFAPHGHTADQIIIRRLRKERNAQALRVVTSDRAIQRVARQVGVRVVTAPEFVEQLLAEPFADEAEAGSQEDIQLSPTEVEAWLKIFGKPKS